MNIQHWINKNTERLDGKRIVISGSTGGLGRELCRYFASLGAELILLDRNKNKSNNLATDLQREFPNLKISLVTADMSDMASVTKATEDILSMSVDYLILNAGAYSIPRETCTTGYDNVYQINFVSPYYLARKLLPGIEQRGGKVIAVGSIAHNYSKIDTTDIDFATRDRASLVYGNAKRYLTYALLSLGSPSVAVAHPGISFTGITNHYPPLLFAIIKYPMKVIFMHPRAACLSVLSAMFTPCRSDEWFGPWIFDIWGRPSKKALHTADASEIKRIVEIAEEIYDKVNNN